MAVTLKDVAERAGVSRSAVSRTFTEGASVSARTRALVEKAAAELGYRPNLLARSLTTRRTALIGLVVDNFRNPLFLDIFDQFTRRLQDRGLRPLLVNLSGQTDPQESLSLLRAYSVDGVVVASSTLPPAFAQAFAHAGVPVVHAFGRPADDPRLPVVGIDNRAGGRLAAETLLRHGYRRIGFLGGPEHATSTQDRLAGFREALPDGALTDLRYASGYRYAAGREEMMHALDAGPAEAYFCGDDLLSIGALTAIEDRGLAVPKDIGILGFNDMEMAGWHNIGLTTIRQPIPQIVAAAIETMGQLLDNDAPPPGSTILDCEVIERGTLRSQT